MNRRSFVVVGELPRDFLRLSPVLAQVSNSEQNDVIGHSLNLNGSELITNYHNLIKLSMTIGQARLAKNYGLTRMDPYCRITIGNTVFETPTAVNGAKNPVWNKVIIMALPPNINNILVELFDEKAFAEDSRFAWTKIVLPEEIFTGKQVTGQYLLSGKQGEQKEGIISIVFTLLGDPEEVANLRKMHGVSFLVKFKNGAEEILNPVTDVDSEQMLMDKTIDEKNVFDEIQAENEQKLAKLKLMFPDIEEEVIITVLDAVGHNIDSCVNSLLDMHSL